MLNFHWNNSVNKPQAKCVNTTFSARSVCVLTRQELDKEESNLDKEMYYLPDLLTFVLRQAVYFKTEIRQEI